MKILLIFNNFTKRLGDEVFVIKLARCFTKKHEVHLLTSTTDLSLKEYYDIPNLIIHQKKVISRPYWLRALVNAYLNTKYAKELKQKHKIDIIYSNSWEAFSCDVVTTHSCYKVWLKIANDILRKESSYLKYLLYSIRRWLLPKNRVFLAVEKSVIEKGSKKITVASKWMKRAILDNYNVPEEKITVAPHAVDLDKFKPNPEKRLEIRERYNIKEDDIVLMLSGYEFKRKGLKYVIEALPLIKGGVKLLAVGEENPRVYKELAGKLGVSDKIIFTGFVPEIKDYYAASDVYVFPTTYEPFGLVILEAMATGLPVVLSELTGAAELIKDGREGVLLKNPTDSKEIAQKINLLVNDKNLRKQMGENARQKAKEYSWYVLAERILDVYKEVLNKEKQYGR